MVENQRQYRGAFDYFFQGNIIAGCIAKDQIQGDETTQIFINPNGGLLVGGAGLIICEGHRLMNMFMFLCF